MNPSKLFLTLSATLIVLRASAVEGAAAINMDDPLRALGREDDVRVDAQLAVDTISPNTPIGVTWQIQNLSKESIAIAARAASASYDEDSRTVTVAIGAEVPPDGAMPQMVVVAPGEKKVFRSAASPAYTAAALRRQLSAGPRFVQVKVAVLRDLTPFLALIEAQGRQGQRSASMPRLTDQQFDQWFESNDTIFLNTLPVKFVPGREVGATAEDRTSF